MVKIRLQRRGRKKAPVYKLVAADARSPRDGRFIEALGQYAPVARPVRIEIDAERALYWLKVGAQPTDTAKSLLSEVGLMLQFHLFRKGKTEEEIQVELEKWRQEKAARSLSSTTKKERRAVRKAHTEAAAMEAEAKTKAEAEAKVKAEQEAKAKAEAEAAAVAAATAAAEAAAAAPPAEEPATDAPAEAAE